MNDFTPSLDEVRAIYALGTPAHHVSIGGSYAEFDRAIAKVRADAKAEALREVAYLLAPNGILWWGDLGVRVSAEPFNPPHVSLDDWLRARADNLEAPNASNT